MIKKNINKIEGVLFDLDGTLLDTVPDLGYALNLLREEHHLPPLPLKDIRSIATLGSVAMIKIALDLDKTAPQFHAVRERFLALYTAHLDKHTTFFPGIEEVLSYLDQKNIPWGIVTNKLKIHTHALLKALDYHHRPACILCGDSLPTYKPDPAPILHACELIKKAPEHCLYVGDAETDVMASKAAGTQSIVALYGYIGEKENAYLWQADGYIEKPLDLMNWLA